MSNAATGLPPRNPASAARGAASAPSRIGATYRISSSTHPPSMNEAASSGPHSTKSFVHLARRQPLDDGTEIEAAAARRHALLRREIRGRAGGFGSRRISRREPQCRSAPEQLRIGRAAALRIENHPQGLPYPGAVLEPHVEPRVIDAHGAGAGQYRRAARTPALHIGARGLPGDPEPATAGGRRAPIQAHGELQPDPRPAALEAGEKSHVESSCLRGAEPDGHRDARRLETPRTRSADPGIGIDARTDDTRHARGDQCVGARRRTAVMAAGLERHVGRRAACGTARDP